MVIASSHPDGPLRRLPGLGLEEVKHSWPAERLQTHSRRFVLWLQSNFSD